METEAAAAGFYAPGGRQCPQAQIIAVEQARRGAKPAIPLIDTGAAFKRAAGSGQDAGQPASGAPDRPASPGRVEAST